jgi:hypothetical protein
MTIQSTSKMLASMLGNNNAQNPETVDTVAQEPVDLFSAPQLKPTADMEHILANILGPSSSKKYSPLD